MSEKDARPMRPGLDALLGNMSSDEFLRDFWPGVPLHIPFENGLRNVELLGIPEFRDFPTLCKSWPHDVLRLPREDGDESQGALIRGQQIEDDFRAGFPMFLHRPERRFARLRRWITALKYELGLPARVKFVCSTHATMGNTRTHLHFDNALSFVLQLRGTKKWLIAPNRSVPNPTTRHSLAMPRLQGDLATYLEEPIPTDPPPDTQEIVLREGGLLFVPNGWWHAVEGVDESLALMFIIINVSWADIVTNQLRRELMKDPAWRGFAAGARTSNARFWAGAARDVEPLLHRAKAALENLRPAEVVEPRYVQEPEVHVTKLAGGRCAFHSEFVQGEVEFEDVDLEIFEAIEALGKSFRAREIVDLGHDPRDVEAVLDALVDVGYLQVE